jgi:virginiamycin B lyase
LPEGNGKALVEAACVQCHTLNRVVAPGHTRDDWQGIVGAMVSNGAEMADNDIPVVVDYLATNFPDTTPKPIGVPGAVQITINEWPVPWERTRPRDPSVAPDGTIWFVGQQGHYVASLKPATGEFKKYELEPGAGPHTQIIDRQGYVWFTANLKGYIGRLDPQTGEIRKFPMPDPAARDPHTMVLDSKGNIFFTVQNGNFVGKLEPATGDVKLVKMSTDGARPYGIILDPEEYAWFNQFGTNKIGRMEPTSLEVKTYNLPDDRARDRRIARTSDGYIWYTDYARGYLGRLDPDTGDVEEWAAPSAANSRPYAIGVDDKGRVWFTETGVRPNQFVGFDPTTEKMFSVTEIKSGGGAIRHMVFDPKTRSFWFGTDTNTIGQAVVP